MAKQILSFIVKKLMLHQIYQVYLKKKTINRSLLPSVIMAVSGNKMKENQQKSHKENKKLESKKKTKNITTTLWTIFFNTKFDKTTQSVISSRIFDAVLWLKNSQDMIKYKCTLFLIRSCLALHLSDSNKNIQMNSAKTCNHCMQW